MNLQRVVFPKFEMCTERELYFRINQFASIDMLNSVIHLEKFGIVHTDTYFNGFSIGKWKKHTNVADLGILLKFRGKIKVKFYLHRLYYSYRALKEVYLESTEVKEVKIPLEFWENLEDGMLAFDVEGLESSEIYSFRYYTETEYLNKINLGVSITHFNRKDYVLPALERLKKELLSDEEFINKVSIYVVDNSKNLPNVKGVTIIPNENLGGAGGFTRGLMELKESGEFTHCLFMDDDASCEIESIKRTINFLEHATETNLAIAGAMLRENEMFRQTENGAQFNGACKPLNDGLDLREYRNLLINEREEKIDYAGWWFFAFPISEVHHYAFPYFVRGDDSGFSLVHNFKIITLNGVSSWQEDFALKNGPLPQYLDTRYHIMHYFHNLVKNSRRNIIRTSRNMILRNLLTYQYETALASICALEDVAKGSNFWRNNVDMMKRRPEILALVKNEKLIDISPELLSQAEIKASMEEEKEKIEEKKKLNGGKIKRIMSLITLNGHLVPKIFFKKNMVAQHKGYGGALNEIYLHRKVMYIHQPTSKGFIVEHSKIKFFGYLFRYFKALTILLLKYRKLSKDYQGTYNELTSAEFWEKYFYRNGGE